MQNMQAKQEREGCSSETACPRRRRARWLEVRGCGSGSGWLRLVLGQRSDRERQAISVVSASDDDVIHSRVGCGSAWEVKIKYTATSPSGQGLVSAECKGKG